MRTRRHDLATRQATLSSLQVRGPWGGVSGTGHIATDRGEQSRIQADISDVDAGTIMRALRLPYVAATRVNGKLQAEWPGLEYLQAKGTADATLNPTASEMSRSAMPVGGRVVAKGNGGRIDAQLVRLAVPGGEVNGAVAITSDLRLEGTIKGTSADVGRLTSSIEAFTGRPRGSLLPTTVAGGAEIDARLAGTVSEPTATTAINAPSLKVGRVEGIALNAEVSYASRTLTVSRADITGPQARAHVDGRVGLGPNQRIELTLTADDVDVATVLQAMNQAGVPISGTFIARGTVSGTTTKPMASINVQGSNLVAYEEQVGSLNADVRLDGRELTLSELVVDKPQPDKPGRLMATGTYNLDRKTYTVDLQSEDLQLLSLVLPGGQRVRGDVQKLAAEGSGSVSSPEGTFDLDVDALETNASQIGRVTVNAVAKNNEATITASADRFNLDANVLVGLMRPWPTTLKVRADNLDLAALPVQRRRTLRRCSSPACRASCAPPSMLLAI